MSIVAAVSQGVPVVLQDAQTSGDGVAIWAPPGATRHIVLLRANGGVTSGSIAVETAHDPNHSDGWATVVTSGVPVNNPGKEKRENFEGAFIALRARIVDPIVGGSVSVFYYGS